MIKKIIRWALIIGGTLVLVVSLLADYLYCGAYPGINGAQIAGAVVGFVALVVGIFLWFKKKKQA